jgi:hypothetical protein
MRLPRLVVLRRAPLQPMGQRAGIKIGGCLPRRDLFHEVQERAAIAIGHRKETVPRLGRKGQRPVKLGFRAFQQQRKLLVGEPFQHQHLRPGQEGGVQLEGGVFGGRPDQQDRPVLHMRQKPILLRLVEAVDLIDEQKRPLPVRVPVPRRLEHFPQVWHAGEDRADLHEMQVSLGGEQARDGGLAHTGRAPEDQRRERSGIEHHPQAALGAQEMRLADDVRKPFRTQTIGERTRPAVPRLSRRWGGVEQIGHQVARLARRSARHQWKLASMRPAQRSAVVPERPNIKCPAFCRAFRKSFTTARTCRPGAVMWLTRRRRMRPRPRRARDPPRPWRRDRDRRIR